LFYSVLLINIGRCLPRYWPSGICCLFYLCTNINSSFHTFLFFLSISIYMPLKMIFPGIYSFSKHLLNTYFTFPTKPLSEAILEYFHFQYWQVSISCYLKVQDFIKSYKYMHGSGCMFWYWYLLIQHQEQILRLLCIYQPPPYQLIIRKRIYIFFVKFIWFVHWRTVDILITSAFTNSVFIHLMHNYWVILFIIRL